MWTILALTIVFYTIDFLVIRGHVVLEGGFRLRWVSRGRVRLELAEANNADEPEARKMATQLLLSVSVPSSIYNTLTFLTFVRYNLSSYPVVYLICVLPFSITRWMSFSGHYVPGPASTFTTSVFSLSGFLNVLLFFKTRPQLIKGGPLPAKPNQDHKHKPQDTRNRGYGQSPLDERQTTHQATVFGSAHQGIMNGNSEGSDGSGFLSTGRHDGGGGMLQQSASSSSHVNSTHRQASHYDEDDREGQGYLPP